MTRFKVVCNKVNLICLFLVNANVNLPSRVFPEFEMMLHLRFPAPL